MWEQTPNPSGAGILMIANALASIPQPYGNDYEIRVDIPYGGYVETGLVVDVAAIDMNGHKLEITGVSATEANATYYFGDEFEYRVTPTDVTAIENVSAGDNLARRVHTTTYNPDAEYEFPLKNHLGSTMVTIYDDGSIAASVYDYFPYGKQKEVEAIASAKTTQTFTGKELDLYEGNSVTGADGEGRYYFGKRYYDADIGKWISTDPIPDYYDLFNYIGGNPMLHIDPNGLLTYNVIRGVPGDPTIGQTKIDVAKVALNIKRQIEQSKGFNKKKDKVYIIPVRTPKEFQTAFTNQASGPIKANFYIGHGGVDVLYPDMRPGKANVSSINFMFMKPNFAEGGCVILGSCNSASLAKFISQEYGIIAAGNKGKTSDAFSNFAPIGEEGRYYYQNGELIENGIELPATGK